MAATDMEITPSLLTDHLDNLPGHVNSVVCYNLINGLHEYSSILADTVGEAPPPSSASRVQSHREAKVSSTRSFSQNHSAISRIFGRSRKWDCKYRPLGDDLLEPS